MTDVQKDVVAALANNDEVITLEGLITGRRFQVIGADQTAAKFLALLTYLIDIIDLQTGQPLVHNVRNIVLSTSGLPMDKDGLPMLASAFYPANTVMINQGHHIDACYADLAGSGHHTSFRAHLWTQLLVSTAHEIIHMGDWHNEVLKGNLKAVLQSQNEETVEARAVQVIINMARTIDLEVPDLDEWYFFGPRVAQLEQAFATSNTPWGAAQAMMITDRVAFMDIGDNNNVVRKSVRDLLIAWSKGDPATWPKGPVTTIGLISDACDPKTAGAVETVFSAEEIAKAEADVAAAVQAVKDEKTAALKGNFVMEFKAACGMEADADVDDATLTIFLMGKGVKLEDLENLANPPVETVIEVAPDGSGTVIIGTGDPAYMGEEDPYADDDPSAWGGEESQYTGGGAAAGQPINVNTAWAQAQNENQETYAAAPVPVATLQAHGMDPATAKATMRMVYERLYHHMFSKCGWSQMQLQQPGQQPFALFDFANVTGVAEPVFIGDIPGVEQLVVAMDCIDNMGGYAFNQPVLKDGQGRIFVKGHTTKDKRMPCYTLHCNFGDGVVRKRLICPQNPHKVKNGQITATAVEARQGHQYVYIIDKTTKTGGFKDGFKDGQWQHA